ncbi:MAG: oligosaccharide flippase family protein, partial [Gemmatimonadaceae bacterium]|nr:oligosaccharide flippase family protein [Gemmatimonadaceae bacterium]
MSLRASALKGGAFIAMREAAGMLVSVAGVLLLTRIIGPHDYGVFASAMGLHLYVSNLSQWGVAVYLIRGNEDESSAAVYDQGFTLLLMLGVSAALIANLVLPFVGHWVSIPEFRAVAAVLLLVLPLQLTNQVPLARLERGLDYRRVALTELSGQFTYYLVAIPVALKGGRYWSPVAGWWAQQLVVGVQLHAMSGLRLRLRWDRALVDKMLGYGLGYSASMWVWQLRSLVNPLIVGRYAGAEAVGYVALAVRVTEYLCFVKTATYRISIATLARVQTEAAKLRRALSEGMILQQLVLGPLLLGFALVGPFIISRFFGPRWSGVMSVYPFVAVGYLANALFSLHSSALYVLRHNWRVTSFHIAHILLFVSAALLCVPRYGVVGYGLAELFAIPAYLVIDRWVRGPIGALEYRNALIWFL